MTKINPIFLHCFFPAYGDFAGDNTMLPAGSHIYPFDLPLPENLPFSFETDDGWVRFHLEGVIDRPWKFDYKTKRPFTVLDVLHLNVIPLAAVGII